MYYLNTNTGRVLPANPILAEYASKKGHLVPCDEKGNKVATDDTPDTEVEQLRAQLTDARTEIEVLKQELDQHKTPAQSKPDVGEPAAPDPEGEATKIDHLVTAIGTLEQGNPDHFTGQGIPRVEALEVYSGYQDVSADERNKAWEQYNA